MLRRISKYMVTKGVQQIRRADLTRNILKKVEEYSRGYSILFLRCRRLLPQSHAGAKHPDRQTSTALYPSELKKSLQELSKVYYFVHVKEALDILGSGKRLKRNIAVLTFDESFAATAELALPILQELKIPALFLVTTEPLDSGAPLWDQEIHTLLEELSPKDLSLPWIDRVLKTKTVKNRQKSLKMLLISLLALSEDLRESHLQQLYERTGFNPSKNTLDRMINRRELEVLSLNQWVSIGAHGHRHVSLVSLDSGSLERELAKPLHILKEICGDSFVEILSYPFGREPYIDEDICEITQKYGYKAGLTAHPGICRPGENAYYLPRYTLRSNKTFEHNYGDQNLNDVLDDLLHFIIGSEERFVTELEG